MYSHLFKFILNVLQCPVMDTSIKCSEYNNYIYFSEYMCASEINLPSKQCRNERKNTVIVLTGVDTLQFDYIA